MWHRQHRPVAADAPAVLITEAAPSLDDQHEARRRKYLIMMSLRVVCLLAAVLTASVSLWLAGIFIVGGLVLPWCAVLIANDRPPKKAQRYTRFDSATSATRLPPGRPSDDHPA